MRHLQPKAIMQPKKNLSHYQPQLSLLKQTLWHQFPEPTRVRCRQLLVQLLQQAVRTTGAERSGHER